MIVEHNGELCSCGNHGCIESYSSIDSIIKKINAKMKDTNTLINEIKLQRNIKTRITK